MRDHGALDRIARSMGRRSDQLAEPESSVRESDSEVARDVEQAVRTVPLRLITVTHTAEGATTARLRIPWSRAQRAPNRGPAVAMIVRVSEVGNEADLAPAGATAAWSGHNFAVDVLRDGGVDLLIAEPDGLTAGTRYRVSIMFLGSYEDLL